MDLGCGHDRVSALIEDMHTGRKKRLIHIGFAEDEAEELSLLHTRNFM